MAVFKFYSLLILGFIMLYGVYEYNKTEEKSNLVYVGIFIPIFIYVFMI